MNLEKLTNPIVRRAVEALQDGNKAAWFALFAENAELYDDGSRRDFMAFSKSAIGKERFTEIHRVENDGRDIYGHFHTEQWGDFNTYFKFQIDEDDKIYRLDIGQAN